MTVDGGMTELWTEEFPDVDTLHDQYCPLSLPDWDI